MYFTFSRLCLIIMACLMNISTQSIVLKASNANKDIIKSCTRSFFALVTLSVFQIVFSILMISTIAIQQPTYYIFLHSLVALRNLLFFYVPFILILIGRKAKKLLITVPIYIEIVSIIVAVKHFDVWSVVVIILSTTYMIMFLLKYQSIMSNWKFDVIEPISASRFVKNFLWGTLLGICIAAWVGMINSYALADNHILLGLVMIIGGISLVAISVAFYLLPTIIAVKKKHLQKVPIVLVNIFLGWSFIGWVVALVWAFMKSKPKVLHIHEEKKSIDLSEKLRSLEELRKDGLITDEEFEIKKSELLKDY